jgi:hypothetical protein
MKPIPRGLLPDTRHEQFARESEPAAIRSCVHIEGCEPNSNVDEEHNLEGEWIDIGGEG